MKKLKVTTGILALAFVSLTVFSCKDNKKEATQDEMHSELTSENEHHHDDSEIKHDDLNTSQTLDGHQQSTATISAIIKNYMTLKDALVADDNAAAKKAGAMTMNALKSFDISGYNAEDQKELKDIIEDATEQAEHISESPIAHQREHFKQLSLDVTDMVAITGFESKMYQQYCPMYDRGTAWLSMSKDIKNPYYGSKMLTCGTIQKEIN
ncbi:DUF3347 domain-containing protein [Flavobacteriaceae bacterium LMO-SS05]